MTFAELNGTRLYYTDDGPTEPRETPSDGAPARSARPPEQALLLVHGWGADSHQWVQHIPTLARRDRVVAVDLRGHGYSSAAESGNTPRQMADDLVGLCAALGVDSVVAIGHSMGGQVVSHLAVEHPDLVRALIAIDPGYGFTGFAAAGMPERIAALREGGTAAAVQIDQWCYTKASPAWLREWHRRRLLAMSPHVLVEAFEAMFGRPDSIGLRPNSDDYLSRRACPVLSFWADPRQAAWERSLFKDPRSRTVAWEGSGHRLHEERPGEFLVVVKNWLAALTREEVTR
jgi:pimeloyl-ACP methyl ester carboxylesterase